MAIAVNIGEAKTRLSQLVAASLRGEEVVLQKAGVPLVRLVAIPEAVTLTREQIAAKRRSAFGMFKKEFEGFDTSIEAFQNLYTDYENKFDDL